MNAKGGPKPRSVYVIGTFAFVPHPGCHGHWLRTPAAVVKVACEVCGSAIGVPCLMARGYGSGMHYQRGHAAKRAKLTRGAQTITITREA